MSSFVVFFLHRNSLNAIDGYEATCFLEYDLNQDGQNDFNRWGWSNGPLAPGSYTFDLYAAAGQCDLTKGTLIGTLTVEYDGLAATVTYHVNPPYTLVETHLYIGSDYLPKNNGEYTVAPGQYPNIHSELANVYEDIYMVTNLSGDIYVVAHGTVAGF
ncbi:hypothetical protein Nhal_2488 [Nitrosococcus halophilus Nc 4]|uniref:Uncharacterized protein n=1 Tax=Nitrosococcus halophilus (strain Nc4) TaxID=472759 RepID=D5BVZ4_NITHN|nr:hypothetical protein [Nitrosococcus halophilus]ADE15573.1 hypothetical protein Nhal_2488 [Nitrosococcus halophilus Nc 4]